MRFFSFFFMVLMSFMPIPASAQEIGTVNFDFDSATIDAKAQAEIAQIAEKLKSTASYKPTVVVGHTDAVGSAGYNQGLGQRRAQAVADALVAAGAPVDRIGTVSSRGKNDLLVRVSGPERRNRRVTVTLDEILDACRSWRRVGLTQSSVGPALQQDLVARAEEAAGWYARLTSSGINTPAFQMAGAAREDCGNAVGFDGAALRKVEYAQRCLCSSARLRVAAGID